MRTKTIFLFALILFSSIGFSQFGPVGHLTIFSEDGDKFFLILNGERINDDPQTNLRVEDLNQPYYNAKIIFEDKSFMDISKNNLMIADVDGTFADVTYKIRRDKNKKGKSKMNFYSQIPVNPNFIPASNVHIVHYGQPRQVAVQQSGTVIQTQNTTIQNNNTNNNNVNVGVNIGGVSMGVSINEPRPRGTVVTQTTTTTTSHSSHDGHNNQQNPIDDNTRGCARKTSMSANNFNAALASVKKQNFEDTALKTAKQVINVNCINVDQIIQIANIFKFEENKLEFVKYAYDFCVDPKNYFKVNSIFTFDSNASELSDYVQSRQ